MRFRKFNVSTLDLSLPSGGISEVVLCAAATTVAPANHQWSLIDAGQPFVTEIVIAEKQDLSKRVEKNQE